MFAGTLMDNTVRMSLDGGPCYHSSLLSTFAEYTVVPEMSCVPMPENMNLIPASMIGCGVATGYGASVRAAGVTAGSTVAVFGVGGVGANAIQGARIAGASQIIACDIKDDNLESVKKFGATDTINTAKVDDVAAAVKAITNGIGADFCIDCTGVPKVGRDAWLSARKGGTTVIIGAYPENGTLELPSGSFHRVGKVLKGSFYGDVNPFNDFPKIAKLYLEGKYDLDNLVIEQIKLEDINKAFDAFHDPKAKNMGRYVIVFED
jgi:S-(hydroxymethyl)glutathione dehydrogenase/alcohol dehydrogenase